MQTKTIDVTLPGRTLQLEGAADLDSLLEGAQEEDQIPFWAELWPAARGLAYYLWQEIDFAGQPVLELGAGLGLAGMVAALKGGQVLQTDFIPEALELAASNAARNGITGIQHRIADWRCFDLQERYPWIIGSDILYEPKVHGHLLRIIEGNLAPGGSLIVADPGRQYAVDFFRSLGVEGWDFRLTTIPVVEDKGSFSIDIYHLRSLRKE